MINFLERGQALVEALLALSVAGMVVAVVTFLVINSLSDSTFTQQQTLATQYARQGLEFMRSFRDNNTATFATYNGTYCLAENSTALNSGPCNTSNGGISAQYSGQFIRQIGVAKDANSSGTCGGGSQVTATVFWSDGKCTSGAYCERVALSTCLATDSF